MTGNWNDKNEDEDEDDVLIGETSVVMPESRKGTILEDHDFFK